MTLKNSQNQKHDRLPTFADEHGAGRGRPGRGPTPGLDDKDAAGYSAGGGDHSDDIVILGESATRSQSPYDHDLDSVTDMADAGDGARSGVGSGQES